MDLQKRAFALACCDELADLISTARACIDDQNKMSEFLVDGAIDGAAEALTNGRMTQHFELTADLGTDTARERAAYLPADLRRDVLTALDVWEHYTIEACDEASFALAEGKALKFVRGIILDGLSRAMSNCEPEMIRLSARLRVWANEESIEEQEPDTPPGEALEEGQQFSKPALVVNASAGEVEHNGIIYRVEGDGLLLLDALVNAKGDYVTEKKLQFRPKRARKTLPKALDDLIESSTGKGTRLKPV